MERIRTTEEMRLKRITKRVHKIKGFYKHLGSYIVVNLFLIGIVYYQLDKDEVFFKFSTFSTAFFWGIGLVFHAFNVFGKDAILGPDWEEKKISEYMGESQNSKWE